MRTMSRPTVPRQQLATTARATARTAGRSAIVRAAVPACRANPIAAAPAVRRAVATAAAAPVSENAPKSSDKAPGKDGKRYVVVTGASSGLGLHAAAHMARSGDYHVVMACRDFAKAQREAQGMGMPSGSFTVMHLDLESLDSVRDFVSNYTARGYPIDALVCNAAVYLPTDPEPSFTPDGFERSVGINHLGHFLLCHLLVDSLAKGTDPRVVIVGSVTGNANTLAGQIPPIADLGDLSGLSRGATMIDGGEYDGAKAYKDSKVCNMLTMREMHKRWHDKYGITFGSLYPGCIAETALFREKRGWFRWLFPRFQKYVTKAYVSQAEAGERLAQVVGSPDTKQSGVYWSWNGEAKNIGEGAAGGSGGLIFENEPSDEVTDDAKAARLWEISEKLVGIA